MDRPGPAETIEPIDPDVEAEDLRGTVREHWPVLCAVSAGGGLGAAARYGAGLLWPTAGGAFPWTTFLINLVGCALIGVVLTVVTHLASPHPLLRPFLATGILGGFTTFSTYAVDIRQLLADDRTATALAYLAATPVAALAAVWATASATRRLLHRQAMS
ncbi:fluoride efflux transporter CrcB [Streptomyces netropsis]|uniref:Fluoride-specific ion channel FluC n=1 Tax=Streptomyces netropsis TaxID=55404 RepID=A0A7W7L5S0_STRNE|nr:CrcB protein [Streptomyces netropsis]GGR05448.1 putative fluoride ion transporter CrcB 1 [Streptomyces netropsis]